MSAEAKGTGNESEEFIHHVAIEVSSSFTRLGLQPLKTEAIMICTLSYLVGSTL